MVLFLWAFLGGVVGAILMDIAEGLISKYGITSGVNIALVGRWFLGMRQGRFTYVNILHSAPVANEKRAGWAFHLVIGGGGVALFYPITFQLLGVPMPTNNLLLGLAFGMASSLLPWFILLPSFGWGMFGRKGPPGSNALLASTLSHLPYGLGVGAVLTAVLKAGLS